MNSWLFFAVLSPLLWALSNPLDAALRRNFVKDDLSLLWIFSISKFVLASVLILIFGLEVDLNSGIFWMVVAGALWTLPGFLFFKAVEFEEISRVALFLQMLPLFGLTMAFLFIGETLGFNQLLAFVIILVAGCLAALKKLDGVWHFSKAFWLIGLACAGWAISDVMFKSFERSFSNFWMAFLYFFLGAGLPGVFLFIVPKKINQVVNNLKKLPLKAWVFFVLTYSFGIGGSLTFAYALTIGKVSLTSVLIGVQPLFVFIFGQTMAKFIKEVPKESMSLQSLVLKGISLILVVIGLIFLEF